MTPLIIVKINGSRPLEETAGILATIKEGFERGALILSDTCDVIAFDEDGRMVYPIRSKEATL